MMARHQAFESTPRDSNVFASREGRRFDHQPRELVFRNTVRRVGGDVSVTPTVLHHPPAILHAFARFEFQRHAKLGMHHTHAPTVEGAPDEDDFDESNAGWCLLVMSHP